MMPVRWRDSVEAIQERTELAKANLERIVMRFGVFPSIQEWGKRRVVQRARRMFLRDYIDALRARVYEAATARKLGTMAQADACAHIMLSFGKFMGKVGELVDAPEVDVAFEHVREALRRTYRVAKGLDRTAADHEEPTPFIDQRPNPLGVRSTEYETDGVTMRKRRVY